jgi:hypothetical protein
VDVGKAGADRRFEQGCAYPSPAFERQRLSKDLFGGLVFERSYPKLSKDMNFRKTALELLV